MINDRIWFDGTIFTFGEMLLIFSMKSKVGIEENSSSYIVELLQVIQDVSWEIDVYLAIEEFSIRDFIYVNDAWGFEFGWGGGIRYIDVDIIKYIYIFILY